MWNGAGMPGNSVGSSSGKIGMVAGSVAAAGAAACPAAAAPVETSATRSSSSRRRTPPILLRRGRDRDGETLQVLHRLPFERRRLILELLHRRQQQRIIGVVDRHPDD